MTRALGALLLGLCLLACDAATSAVDAGATPVDAGSFASDDGGAPTHDGGPTATDAGGPTATGAPASMPVVSRDRPVFASGGSAGYATDDTVYYWGSTPAPGAPTWVAVDVGAGPSALMVELLAQGLGDYSLETSSDSTDGSDGAWVEALAVTDNPSHARVHVVPFEGRSWLRLTIRAASDGGEVLLHELTAHDASLGTTDSYLFLGDSISAGAYNFAVGDGSFEAAVRERVPDHEPVALGIGVGGTTTTEALEHLDEWLERYADVHHWVVSYGTNDSATGDVAHAGAYGERLRAIVTRLQAAGHVVLVPRIPYKTGGEAYLAAYEAEVDAVVEELGAVAGPDFYAFFIEHPELFGDAVHPNEAGSAEMHRLWAEAVAPRYR